jgi:CYTH domain-containing protein
VPAEIERRFLPLAPPAAWPVEVVAKSVVEISQGYLTADGVDPEVRLRKAREVEDPVSDEVPASRIGPGGLNVVRKLAVKSAAILDGDTRLVRREIEVDLEQDDFDEAWLLTVGRRLQKLRRSVTVRLGDDLLAFSVDEFHGSLAGLRIAEIEFEDLTRARAFAPPGFLGREITDDQRYRNSSLAVAAEPPTPTYEGG